jgi:hypothetical protein
MRYLASIVFACLGLFFFLGSLVAGVGVIKSGNTLGGILLAGPGISLLFLASRITRDLYGGPIIRGGINLLLGLGSTALVTGLIMLGMRVLNPSDADSPFYLGSFLYQIVFGALSLGSLLILTRAPKESGLNLRMGSDEHRS